MSDYLFFWNGIYSQWYPSKFVDFYGIEYNCAEQYMMAEKARMFHDLSSFNKIMNTDQPAEQKAFGRKVKNFEKDVWEHTAKDIVTMGNYFKFTQNTNLLKELMLTGNFTIVEASPYDKIWGIGMGVDHPDINDSDKWQGKNWLGECIMNVRTMLRTNDENYI